MSLGTGRARRAPAGRAAGNPKLYKFKFRLYTGACFLISGLMLMIFSYFVKN